MSLNKKLPEASSVGRHPRVKLDVCSVSIHSGFGLVHLCNPFFSGRISLPQEHQDSPLSRGHAPPQGESRGDLAWSLSPLGVEGPLYLARPGKGSMESKGLRPGRRAVGHGRDLASTLGITLEGFSTRFVFLPNFLLRSWWSVQSFLSVGDEGLSEVTGWMGAVP